jgi:HAL2 family 3'(2'),5'-bisphosphate nucleotidase
MAFEKELDAALLAVRTAAQLCKDTQFSLVTTDTLEKKDRSPVTIADFGSQAIVSSILFEHLPGDLLVGEEDVNELKQNNDMLKKVHHLVRKHLPDMSIEDLLASISRGNAEPDYGGRYWTVDPIDGTKGFLRKEQYAVALALVENGEIKLGVLGCPNLPLDLSAPEKDAGCIVYAVRGAGAFMCDLQGDNVVPIHVDGFVDAKMARFVESVESAHSAHSVHEKISSAMGITEKPLRIDSQCKYAAVARGDVSIYLRFPKDDVYREKIWDHAAGVIVVEEAGGAVTDVFGVPLDFTRGRTLAGNRGVVATSGAFHNQIINVISEL